MSEDNLHLLKAGIGKLPQNFSLFVVKKMRQAVLPIAQVVLHNAKDQPEIRCPKGL